MPIYPRWQSKPWPGVGIDGNQSLANGLTFAADFREGSGAPVDTIAGNVGVLHGTTGTPTWSATPYGAGMTWVGPNTQWLDFGTLSAAQAPTSTEWSMGFAAIVKSGASNTGISSIVSSGNPQNVVRMMDGTDQVRLYFNDTSNINWTYTGTNQAAWHQYLFTRSGNTLELWVDGVSLGTQTSSATWNWTGGPLRLGVLDSAGDNPFDGQIAYWRIWNRVLASAEITSHAGNPWQVFQPQAGWLFSPSTAAALSASVGFFVETGNAASLKHGYRFSASTGTFTETANAASLKHGYRIATNTGAFTETGNTASLKSGHVLTASAGSFTETSIAAGLRHGYPFSASTGIFTETGQAASFRWNHLLTASAGLFVETGNAAGLTKTGGVAWYNTAWTRRLPLTVDNTANTTSALSYYQAGISLTGAAYTSFHAHAKSDGSDIRVTDSDGTTLLNFALEGIDTTNSVVYLLVKVPAVAAASSRTIYIYYGNASATSTSSYASTVGPTVAITGPTDEWTQTDASGVNANEVAVLLKNQGGVHGGGASLNGKILCFLMAGSVGNGDRTNSSIGLMSSADGGVTWGSKSILLAHAGSNVAEPRGVAELADGTILLVYSMDTATISSAGQAKMWIAKSTDGGATWSNLSITAPTNPIAVPWTYGTDGGSPYGRPIEVTPGGDLLLAVYGKIATDTGTHARLMKCPSGSDPTDGTTWSQVGIIAYDNVNLFREPCVIPTTDSSHLLAVMRNDTVGDLYTCTSADTGATWTTPVAMGMPGYVQHGTGGAVSPELLKLASGNYLLCWGVRYGSDYGSVQAVISTDGGATWLDRAPFGTITGNGSTLWDGGYPTAVQNADGTICVLAYRNLGALTSDNVFRMIFTEDYIVNCNNVYEPCESFDSLFTAHGTDAMISTTHVHNGTNAVKFDDSTGTHLANARIQAWSTNSAKNTGKVAYSCWQYATQIATQAWTQKISDATPTDRTTVAIRNVTQSYDVAWNNGAVYTTTGALASINAWHKITVAANVAASSVTGRIRLNNVTATSSMGQFASGTAPQSIIFQAGSTASTNSVTVWLDDFYTHQYTANVPILTASNEQTSFSAGTGVFTETGQAAALRWNHVLGASAGTLIETGNAASLKYGHALVATTGTFAETGNNALLVYTPAGHFTLAAAAGSVSETGNAASLRWTHAVTAAAGSFAETENAATLRTDRRLSASGGSFIETGNAATLVYTPISHLTLAAGTGLFLETGHAASLLYFSPGLAVYPDPFGSTITSAGVDPFGATVIAAIDPYGSTARLKGN